MPAIEVVLFDVGGVLVDISGADPFLAQLAPMPAETFWRNWLLSPAVRAFETGRIDPVSFASQVLVELRVPMAVPQFLDSFIDWPTAPFPGTLELLRDARSRVRTAMFSNTNVLHWPRFLDEMGLGAAVDQPFASHLLGELKPDAAAFELVLEGLQCEASRVLFLDDNALNVDAARALGFRAQRVRGNAEARQALREAGVLDAREPQRVF